MIHQINQAPFESSHGDDDDDDVDDDGDDQGDDGDDDVDLLPDIVSHQDLLDLGCDGQRIQLIRQSRHLVQTWTCELSSSS